MTRTRWAATALTALVMLWSILYAPGSWAVGVPPAPAPSAPTPKAASQSAGTFVPIDPLRLWEHQDVGPGGTLTAHLSGLAEVPEGAIGAVVLNVTAYPLSSGYLTVYPSGGSRPLASSINYDAGRPVANLVTVKVGADGEVAFYNHSSGAAAIYADIQGYYLSGDGTAAGSLRPMTPVRVLDTCDGTGAPQRRLTNEAVTLTLGGRYGVPTNASAVLLNVTAVETTMPGYVTASPAGEPRPTASALNFPGNGLTRAGATVVKLGAGGAVDLFAASTGRLDLVADLSGYYVGGTPTEPGTFVSLSPRRHLDQVLGGGQRVTVGVGGTPDIPADAGAVVTTLTVDAAQLPGWFRAMPSGSQEGTVSNLNFVERETRANLAVVKLGADGAFSLMNGASGNARAVSDVSGYFRASTQTWPLLTASSVSTAAGTTCVLDTSRQVWCWGDNIHGQFGNGNRRSTPIPTRLRNLPPDVTQVRVSHRRVCVLAGPATGGDVYCSGAFTNDLSSSGQDMLVDPPKSTCLLCGRGPSSFPGGQPLTSTEHAFSLLNVSSNPADLSTEARIRYAAVELFGEQGFAHTTIRQVAERAGVSAPLVMHHFKSKDGLRQACDDWAMEVLVREKDLFSLGGMPAMDDLLDQHPEYRSLLAYLASALRAGGSTADRIFDRLVETSTELVDHLVDAGMLQLPADREAAIAYLVSCSCGVMLLGTQFSRHLGGTSITDPKVMARYSAMTAELFSTPMIAPSFRDVLLASVQTQHHTEEDPR